jgi:regulator of replication initiation timing
MLWQRGMLRKRHDFCWELLERRSEYTNRKFRFSVWRMAGGDMSTTRWFDGLRWMTLLGVMMWTAFSIAQEAANRAEPPSPKPLSNPVSDSVRELREQVRELQAAVAGMRSDWQRARAETAELRRELDEIRTREVRAETTPRNAVVRDAVEKSEISNSEGAARLQDSLRNFLPSGAPQDEEQVPKHEEDRQEGGHAASLEEEYQLLSGKVDDQYQTKVESASKYRLRLSGIVLMNLVSNQGTVDSIDLPLLAYARPAGDSGGSFGATLRQSEIGFEAFGPTVAGARTRADLQLDLAGGFPSVPNGVNSGILRLRTGTMRMDWTNTSVVVGQDGIFFSPNSPTSFASLAVPALSYAGNLWSWVPQIRVEHRVAVGEISSLMLQAGILDPLSGEVPAAGSYRQAGPGASARQPAYGTRIAWTRNVFGQPLRVGVGGFYSRQDYGFSRTVDAWAAMTDLELPLSRQVSLSGKLYRGKALGGLYGAFGQSALFSGDPALASTEVHGLNSVGGWAQLKYRPASKWEFNAAFGMDNPYATDLEYFPYSQLYGGGNATLARNRGSFVNMIYRPRSDLLFSAEYRHLTTYTINNGGNNAGHLNLMMGVLF